MLNHAQAEFRDRLLCINCGSSQLSELSGGKFTDQPLRGFIEADPWGESPIPYLQDATWSLVQCCNCNQKFHGRILTDFWNEKRFSSWMTAAAIREFEIRAAGKSSVHERQFNAARSHVEHVLRLERLTRSLRSRQEPVRLLDFGCGWGEFLLACKLFGFDVVGVDRSTARIDGAILNIYSSVEELCERPPFHAVTFFEVLEHLDDPAAVVERLASMLNPGGILVAETPDCSGITDIRTHTDYLGVHPLDHLNAFTRQTLTSMICRRGFVSIPRKTTHVTVDKLRVIKTEVKHWLGRDKTTTQLYFRKK
jgi:2-polyprenyl-3-methyl-5-hydroxy-6-metoxy-1,4-benzoquinol methylase